MNGATQELRDQHRFFKNVAEARNRILLMDYDGTIAPFSADPRRAFPYAGVKELLQHINSDCGTRLIVVTGRPAHEVIPLLGFIPSEIWGTDGLEKVYGHDGGRYGQYDESEISAEAVQALAVAEFRLDSEGLREQIEVKLSGVAVHWRGLEPSEILKIRTKAYRILEPLARQTGLVMPVFEEGIELRFRSACKGNAMRKLLLDLDAGVPIAYVGDTIDEDAFRVLNGRGLAVLLTPKHKFTSAQICLTPPARLITFLQDWILACEGRQ